MADTFQERSLDVIAKRTGSLNPAAILETPLPALETAKFRDPHLTADGSRRAHVRLESLDTLWFNTGTLCNIECVNCYIESSPQNDRLVYLTLDEVREYVDEIESRGLPTAEIGFTGGEPFMNPDLLPMLEDVLGRGLRALVLTNAMQPLQRPKVQEALIALEHRERLVFRVSLDHHTEVFHDTERGAGSWAVALSGLRWLAEHGFRLNVAGRTCWGETESDARDGYARLFEAEGLPVAAADHGELVLFPEMDEAADVPEITVDCWDILGQSPSNVMCASSRMVVKRRGASRPAVLACTLLPYDEAFELGATLADGEADVLLNHPHCSKFCVLGGGSCSAAT